MQIVLVMFRGDGERRSFSLTRDVTVVGRREDCDLRIPLGDVSRKHCRFIRDADTLRIEDLGSSNDTFLNGTRVDKEAILQAGDSVQVGPVMFVVQIDGYPAEEDMHPISPEAATAPQAEHDGMESVGGPPPVPDLEGSHAIEGLGEPPPLDDLDDLEPLPLPDELGESGKLDIEP